jgi:hypothetical protein
MKALIIFSLFFASGYALAGEGPFSLGAVLGEPTGFTARQNLSESYFIDGGIAWSGYGAHLYTNYLRNYPGRYQLGSQPMDLYFGFGVRLISLATDKNKNKVAIAPRAPIGTAFAIRDPDLQFFGEAALNLDITPETSADLDVGIGLRYQF